MRLALEPEGPFRDVDSVRFDVTAGPESHTEAALFVLERSSEGRLIRSDVGLRLQDGRYVGEARAGRMTSGTFGSVTLVAAAGSSACLSARFLSDMKAAGCVTASRTVIVAPPPLGVDLEVVRTDILAAGGDEATAALSVPWSGRVRLRLRGDPIPIRGDVTHHAWVRPSTPDARWTRLTPPEGVASDERTIELEAQRLLPRPADEGELVIWSGPQGMVGPTPQEQVSPAFRTTRVRLARPSDEGDRR